jgi:hypothetical protein
MSSKSSDQHDHPDYVVNLEAAYGVASQAGFGSAVFFDQTDSAGALEKKALEKYEYFLGDRWNSVGKDVWMCKWKKVYTRSDHAAQRKIVDELRSIADVDARVSVPMILDNIENAQNAQQALSAAFDDSAATELAVYNIGDGEAMSGLIVAGRRSNGETAVLVFLMD